MYSVLIAAGGTGGHVIPGICIAKGLTERGINIQWVGSRHGIESRLVPEAGIPFYAMPVRSLRGKGIMARIGSLIYLLVALINALLALFKYRPSMVLGMGGYVSGPCGLAAWLLRIPVVVHEQNSIPGLTNRLLAKIAARVMVGYPHAFSDDGKAVYTGNPVRQPMLDIPPPATRLQGRADTSLRVLVMGGSQGARIINRMIPLVLSRLTKERTLEVVHQTGKNDVVTVTAHYRQKGVDAQVFSFIENISHYYQWADLVIARSGALTIAEIMVAGVASILVPYPYAVDDHQTKNAESLVATDAAILVHEKDLSECRTAELIKGLDRNKIMDMSVAAHHLAKPEATREAVDTCQRLIEEKG